MDLFEITTGFQGCQGRGATAECPPARNASIEERNAYLRWLASRDGVAIPTGATFGPEGIKVAGELIVAMPGYDDPRRATLEVLDDAGNVIRSTPIAVDARGHMTLSKAQVREACGLAPVKAKRGKAATVAPTPIQASPAPLDEPAPPLPVAEPEAAPADERKPEPWPQDYVTGPEASGRRARLENQAREIPSWASGPAARKWCKGWDFADAYLSATPEFAASKPVETQEAIAVAPEAVEMADALHGAEIASTEISGEHESLMVHSSGAGDSMGHVHATTDRQCIRGINSSGIAAIARDGAPEAENETSRGRPDRGADGEGLRSAKRFRDRHQNRQAASVSPIVRGRRIGAKVVPLLTARGSIRGNAAPLSAGSSIDHQAVSGRTAKGRFLHPGNSVGGGVRRIAPQEARGEGGGPEAPAAFREQRSNDVCESGRRGRGTGVVRHRGGNSAPSVNPTPIAVIEARLAALEAALAALPAQSDGTADAVEKIDKAPTMAKRTPAHERAIRRAWAERKARRGAIAGMKIHARRIDAMEMELRLAKDEHALDKQAIGEAYARAEQFARRGNQHASRRLAAARRARRMIASARAEAARQQGRATMAEAALAKLKRDMADPTQPERASDIARLTKDRDQARAAVAALQGRAERAEAARDMLADKFEEMVSRVARAEAAVRKLAA